MPTDIVIPSLGESITEGVIASWLKKEGEHVDRDEPLLELETDKITMEVPAPAAGVVSPKVGEGETVNVGAVVGSIAEGEGKSSGGASSKAASASEGASEPPKKQSSAAVKDASPDGGGEDDHQAGSDVRATPLARKIAQEHNVDLGRVHASGPGGRVREQDVLDFVKGANGAATGSAPASGSPPAAQPSAAGGGRGTKRTPMSKLRQTIASRLVEAQQTAAMLTTFNECDMTKVMGLRSKHKDAFQEKHGVKLGFMSFFVKACVEGLRAYPKVNSQIAQGAKGPEIVEHEYCDIAMAVSTPKGLVVPVVRNCESLSFAQIESALVDLGTRAREGKIELHEMQGGTFTITNGGIFGSMMSTPILNPPQSGILGMHNIVRRPVENPDKPGSGEVVVRPMMYLALSYDHRVIDGAEAVRFLVKVKECIEDPERMLLSV